MHAFEVLIVIFISIYLALGIFFTIGLLRLPITQSVEDDLPSISLLISCRNEKLDLPTCIKTIETLDYPKDRLQVVLIDDLSDDGTDDIIKDAAARNDHFEAYSTADFPETHLEAKGRGIALAASKASGDWLFISDADASLPTGWIKHMLSGVSDRTGMMVGFMEPINTGWRASIEKATVTFALPIGFGLAGWGIKLLGLGPNMTIRRDIYEQAGGLENSDFAVAEDLALFNMVKNGGYDVLYRIDPSTTVNLAPVPSLKHLFSQQRRWMRGGFQGKLLEWVAFMLLFGFGLLFAVAYIGGWFLNPQLMIVVTLIKILAQLFMFGAVKWRLKSSGIIRLIPVSIIYTLLTLIWLPLSFIFSPNIKWLGEGYEVNYN